MSEVNQLYDRDFNLWIKKSIAAIKERDFASIDWDNLLVEIEDMGKSQKRAKTKLYQTVNSTYLKTSVLGIRKREKC